MANLSRDDVLKLARLARIELSEDEIAEYQVELSQILAYVEQLQQVDNTGWTPTNPVTGLKNVMRDDTVYDYGYTPRSLLANVALVKDNQIQVKRMVD